MSQATFGKRASLPGQRPAAPVPRSGASVVAEAPAERYGGGVVGDILDQIQNAPDAPVEALWRSYFKACVTGFVTALLISGLFLDGASSADSSLLGDMFRRLSLQIPSMVLMLTLAPALAPFMRVAADVTRVMRIPPGPAYMLIGGVFGGLMLLPDIAAGTIPEPAKFSFLIGGVVGGFAFWRARGYPGTNKTGRSMGEAAHIAMQEARKHL